MKKTVSVIPSPDAVHRARLDLAAERARQGRAGVIDEDDQDIRDVGGQTPLRNARAIGHFLDLRPAILADKGRQKQQHVLRRQPGCTGSATGVLGFAFIVRPSLSANRALCTSGRRGSPFFDDEARLTGESSYRPSRDRQRGLGAVDGLRLQQRRMRVTHMEARVLGLGSGADDFRRYRRSHSQSQRADPEAAAGSRPHSEPCRERHAASQPGRAQTGLTPEQPESSKQSGQQASPFR